jgi:hypothetical protein
MCKPTENRFEPFAEIEKKDELKPSALNIAKIKALPKVGTSIEASPRSQAGNILQRYTYE